MTDGPVVTLTNAILLSALKKGAEAIRFRPEGTQVVVELRVAGETVEELREGTALLGAVMRRLSVMASLPAYKKGECATGFIHLTIGEQRNAYFAIKVEGHGPALSAQLRVLTEGEYRDESTS